MNNAVILFLNLGGSEIAVIMLFVLMFFGADKIPELARGLGKGMRQFKDAMNGIEQEVKRAATDIESEVKKNINEAAPLGETLKEVTNTVKRGNEEIKETLAAENGEKKTD